MRDLTANLKKRTWSDTVRRFMGEVGNNPDWFDNLTVDGRYAWRLLLELPADGVALDLGCGLGNLAMNLAPNVGHMVGMDLTMERLEFTRERFAAFKREDQITLVAGGDGRHLPFRDGMFDLVTLSGVLEWIPDDERTWDGPGGKLGKAIRMLASFFGSSNPRRVQTEFLREIRRILKPHGQLFVAIENRLGYEYFLGMPDHHSGLKFNSLLPRFLANIYSIARARKPYRTYTYSIPGFKRLIRDAGYTDAEFFGLTPGYTHLAEITPATVKNAVWAPTRRGPAPSRLKESALLVPAYGIVVSKSAETIGSALINRIGARIEKEAGTAIGDFRISRWRVTGKDKAILDARLGNRSVIVRIPLNSLAEEAEARNWGAITQSQWNGPTHRLTPTPIVRGAEQGLSYFVESKVSGISITHAMRNGADPATFLADAIAIPQNLTPRQVPRTKIELEGHLYDRLVQQPLNRVAKISGMSAEAGAIGDLLHRSLYGASVTLGMSHGDLTTDNILVDKDQIAGVIDWEDHNSQGMPLLDVFAYLESVCRVRSPALNVAATFGSLGGRLDLLTSKEAAALENAFSALETPYEYRPAIAKLAWVYHCDALLRTQAACDTNLIERCVVQLFRVDQSEPITMPMSSRLDPVS